MPFPRTSTRKGYTPRSVACSSIASCSRSSFCPTMLASGQPCAIGVPLLGANGALPTFGSKLVRAQPQAPRVNPRGLLQRIAHREFVHEFSQQDFSDFLCYRGGIRFAGGLWRDALHAK